MELPAEFQPECFSRRGEVTAWGLALLACLAWGWVSARGFATPTTLKFIAGFCLLAGLAISLTNWMDRRTHLRLDQTGVAFENGLRRVRLAWDDVREMRVFPSNLGDQVRVMGERTFFMFRTLGEAGMGSRPSVRMGFAQGERIAALIRQKAGLTHVRQTGSAYYYLRE